MQLSRHGRKQNFYKFVTYFFELATFVFASIPELTHQTVNINCSVDNLAGFTGAGDSLPDSLYAGPSPAG